ncbi:MAG: MFS transporter [Ancrocorticia sp.]
MVRSRGFAQRGGRSATLPVAIGFGLIASILYGLGAGLRADIGVLLGPMTESSGLTYQDVSLCVAVLQLVFGASQPIFGIVALRRSNRFVLLIGVGLLAASLVTIPYAHSFIGLFLSLGVLLGVGCGALAFGVILGSVTRLVGPHRAMLVSGMLNASAGLGAFALSPVIQTLEASHGMAGAMLVLCIPVALLIPLVFVVTSGDAPTNEISSASQDGKREESSPSARALFKDALSNRTYRLLIAGFTTCGFHMVIIETHLFSQFVSYDITPGVSAWVFSLYGIFTIAGALLSGYLSTRVRKDRLLGSYYGFRAVWVLAYIFLAPKNVFTAILFSAGLGLTGDATVSPTAGLVNEHFTLSRAAALIGFLFFCHQIGAFASAWLGGVLLNLTGTYTAVWVLDAAFCAFACVASLRIGKQTT